MSKRKPKTTSLPTSLRKLYPNVKYAVDANYPIEVSVKNSDCTDAVEMDPTNCALAKAAKREYKADGVIIGISSSYIIKGDIATRFATPERVQREIVSFDRHHDFAPGEYTLVPKPPTAKFGESYRKRPNREGGKNKTARRIRHTSARIRVLPKGHQGEE
jgi:hypothetical protein